MCDFFIIHQSPKLVLEIELELEFKVSLRILGASVIKGLRVKRELRRYSPTDRRGERDSGGTEMAKIPRAGRRRRRGIPHKLISVGRWRLPELGEGGDVGVGGVTRALKSGNGTRKKKKSKERETGIWILDRRIRI